MMASISKNILATLAYYDVLRYPLTSFEVRKYLLNYHPASSGPAKASLALVTEKLKELQSAGHVETNNGFWFLRGKSELVTERIAKEKISAGKLKRMRRLISILRYLPFVRMVASTGSLSFRHGSPKSDWDMLIVLEEKALFTGRFILSLFLHIIGRRRHGKKIIDRACLNYFTGSKSLVVRLQDWYASHEYQVMIPLFQTFSQDAFYRANSWLLDFRNHAHLPVTEHRLQISDTNTSKKTRGFLERFLYNPYLEKQLAAFQKKKIARNPRTALKGSCIIADEHSLVFFPEPRGPKVFKEFQNRLRF